VARTAPGEMEPMCYQDEEKTHTLVARKFVERQLREKGLIDAAVDAEMINVVAGANFGQTRISEWPPALTL